ncbi:MAG: hypothetical protein ACE5NC_01420 [Anaerolineae bacterium]
MAEEDQNPDSEGEGIHLPAPTMGPPLLGLGTGLTLAGLAVGGPLLLLPGAAIGAVGLGVWLRDSAREAAQHE